MGQKELLNIHILKLFPMFLHYLVFINNWGAPCLTPCWNNFATYWYKAAAQPKNLGSNGRSPPHEAAKPRSGAAD
jgi:hypothetical protein